jgi:hypothetical protein
MTKKEIIVRINEIGNGKDYTAGIIRSVIGQPLYTITATLNAMERAKKETLLMILAELKNRAETAETAAETAETFQCCESDNRNRCLLIISRRMPDNCAMIATGAIIRQ